MFDLVKSWMSSKLGHVGSKTRSRGQIIEKACLHNSGHTFDPIFMKLGQNVCLGELWDEFETGSRGVKN